jgi:hypothetical protein
VRELAGHVCDARGQSDSKGGEASCSQRSALAARKTEPPEPAQTATVLMGAAVDTHAMSSIVVAT